jgi:alpha-L-rhamnosidase
MVAKGATTVWELWNGDTADPSMNSGNHLMLAGDLVIWFYETLAGIAPDPADPGFKHIIMKPVPVGDLSFVKASHRSPYGMIISEWSLKNGRFDWNVTVPPNSTATVYVPASSASIVTVDGKPIADTQGIKLVHEKNGAVVLDIESGSYRFTSQNVQSIVQQ